MAHFVASQLPSICPLGPFSWIALAAAGMCFDAVHEIVPVPAATSPYMEGGECGSMRAAVVPVARPVFAIQLLVSKVPLDFRVS